MDIKDLQPIKGMPKNLIIVPTFLSGALKDAVIPAYLESTKGNSNFSFYDTDKESARGSSPIINGAVNCVLRDSKFRTAVPTDNIYSTIFPMIEGNFYTDFNAFDVREMKHSYERNDTLWKRVIELAEEKQGSVKFPFRMQGFYCILDKNEKGYGFGILPANNFRIIEDERLNLLSETRFNLLDENGIIVPDKKGKFNWYTIDDGLSRVCMDGVGVLSSGDGSLASSDDYGRVVVVNAKGVAPNFPAIDYNSQIEKIYQEKITKAEEIKTNALEALAKL